jgi:hypothetical protein
MTKKTGNKFGAKKVTDPFTGEIFDSKAEHHRWCELRILERAGRVSDLQRQVTFELIPTQREEGSEFYKAGPQKGLPKPGAVIEKPVKYVADFVYVDDKGIKVVEDVKGLKRGAAYDLFAIKRKLMLWIHGIIVVEI